MATSVIMPRLGLTMAEGTIIRWLKAEGDYVEEGEPLVTIETDKTSYEEVAKSSGYLLKIFCAEGETVPILQVIAIIGRLGEEIPEIVSATASSPGEETLVLGDRSEDLVVPDAKNAGILRISASPLARSLAKNLGIELSAIVLENGRKRIIADDVRRFHTLSIMAISSTTNVGHESFKQREEPSAPGVALTGMRKVIAQRTTQSKTTTPHFYLSVDVQMDNALRLREQFAKAAIERYGTKFSINAVLFSAVAAALSEYPKVNAQYHDGGVVYNKVPNVGLAVALEDGVVVPVINNVQTKSVGAISCELDAMIRKSHENVLKPEDCTGGSLTISNLGMYGVRSFSAIINPPESAILAIGEITKQAVVVENDICVRSIMNVTASFDHRIVDGALGADFLRRFKQLVENPDVLLV